MVKKKSAPKNKGGRPPKTFKWDLLNSILAYGASLTDCSDFLDVSEDTIQRNIKKKCDIKFSEYRLRKMSKIRLTLLQKQYNIAKEGNVTMLIWLGKQMLGQADKQKIDETLKVSFTQLVKDLEED